MKKTLLASSALVAASLLAAPAMAGTVGSRDSMAVTVGGTLWFAFQLVDEDVSAGQGQGYGFKVNESEIHVGASNTADNGIKYGVNVELSGGGADATSADEAYAYIDSDVWGRLELGDQDDVTNRMMLGSWNAHKGLGGPFGGLGMLLSGWESLGAANLMSRADHQALTSGDDTKASYFSPRFGGFQVGASLTPDTGVNAGGVASLLDTDNDGDYNNVIGLAANYVGKFDDIGVGLSVFYETGDDVNVTGVNNSAEIEDLEILGIGGNISTAGFTFGAHYRDLNNSEMTAAQVAAGASGGEQWSVGLGYQAGPWGVSVWYLDAERNAATSAVTTEVTRLGFGAGYTVAPGWLLRADLEFLQHDNIAGVATTDNDGRGFLLTNMFSF
jgi:outer membrane protein OmpU